MTTEPSLIDSSFDLNNLSDGWYYWEASLPTNYPAAPDPTFQNLLQRSDPANSNRFQYCFATNSSQTWIREQKNKVWNSWRRQLDTSDLSNFASTTAGQGASLVGTESGATVQQELPSRLLFADYTALRAYVHLHAVDQVYVYGTGIAGKFYADTADSSSADNGGTIIVANDGTRWKRAGATPHEVHLKWWGLSNETDDSAKIKAALAYATSDPIANLAYIVGLSIFATTIHLDGNWYTAESIPLPFGGGITFTGGEIIPTSAIPSTDFVFKMLGDASTKQTAYENIRFRNVTIDCGHHCGAIYAEDFVRVAVEDCYIVHFAGDGISFQNNYQTSHEGIIDGGYIGEYISGESASRTANVINLASNDNILSNFVVFGGNYGIYLTGAGNFYSQVHIYGVRYCVWGTATSYNNYFTGCYFDSSGLHLQCMDAFHFVNCNFLANFGYAGAYIIEFEPQVANKTIKGLVIIGCNFAQGNAAYPAIVMHTVGSAGSLDRANSDQNRVLNNTFNANIQHPISSQPRVKVALSNASSVSYNFNLEMPFGEPKSARISLQSSTPQATSYTLSGASVTGYVPAATTASMDIVAFANSDE